MNNDDKCVICNTQAEIYTNLQDDKDVICPKCGEYFISGTVLAYFQYEDIKQYLPKISSWISEQNKVFGIKRPEVCTDTADRIVTQKDKTIKEKFDCFMNTIKSLPSKQVISSSFNHCYIYDDIELGLFFQKALEKNYIKGKNNQSMGEIPFLMFGGITFDGLEYIESLSEINKNSKNIFVAFYFDEEHLMQTLFDNDVKNAIENLGFNYVRVSSSATDTHKLINDEIIGKIKSAKIVIADFTGQRNSVYFEAGFAMGLKIPVIWSCKDSKDEILSFDTRQYPHILWKTKEEFVEKLVQRIKTLI